MTQSEKRLFLIQSLLKERSEYRRVETPRDSEGQRQLLRGLMNVRPPQAADPDFLRVQDAYLQAETAARGITDLADLTPVQPGLYVWQGYNTPVIIKYPFWRMTAANPRAVYACLNLGQAAAPGRFRSSPSASTGTSELCWPVWVKILLSLQVWNLFAFGEQILRAADCKPFVKKGEALF